MQALVPSQPVLATAAATPAGLPGTSIASPQPQGSMDPWVERWTVDRCGVSVYYRVELRPNKSGGKDFGVSQFDDTLPDMKPPPAAHGRGTPRPEKRRRSIERTAVSPRIRRRGTTDSCASARRQVSGLPRP